MTSAVKQAGNEHSGVVARFPPVRDVSRLQSQFSHFWYSDKPRPDGFPSDQIGAATPVFCDRVLKVEANADAECTRISDVNVLPHWMDSNRGAMASRLLATPETGLFTPMKAPPLTNLMTETPNSVLDFSSSSLLQVGMSSLEQRKLTWTRPTSTSVTSALSGISVSPQVSASRLSLLSGISQDAVQSQKENVASLGRMNAAHIAVLSPQKGNTSPSTLRQPIGHPSSARVLATIGSSKKSSFASEDLQLQLLPEPLTHTSTTSLSLEKHHGGDCRIHHNLGFIESSLVRMKAELKSELKNAKGIPSKPERNNLFSLVNGSLQSMLNSGLFSCQQLLQSDSKSESSAVHADLSLTLQPACEMVELGCRGNMETSSAQDSTRWSETGPPPTFSGSAREIYVAKSLGTSDPPTQFENLLVFQLLPTADTVAPEAEAEQEIGLGSKKRKQIRKLHKSDVSRVPTLSGVDITSSAEHPNQRLKKRVKNEVEDMHNSTFHHKNGAQQECSSLEISLCNTELAVHPRRHNFFPDKPSKQEPAISFQSNELSNIQSPASAWKDETTSRVEIDEDAVLMQACDKDIDQQSGQKCDSTPPERSRKQSQSDPEGLQTLQSVAKRVDVINEHCCLGGESASVTLSSTLSERLRGLPEVLNQGIEGGGREPRQDDVSWQRTKICTVPAYAPMPIHNSTVSAGEPSLPLTLSFSRKVLGSTGQTGRNSTLSPGEEWGKSLALCATPVAVTPQQSAEEQVYQDQVGYQERFALLQAFLKRCDERDESELLQALRTLSPAARSGHAVDLETRAMWLSIEEGKEMSRVKMLNVMGWNLGSCIQGNTSEDDRNTPRGQRLPVPGVASIENLSPSAAAPYHSWAVSSLPSSAAMAGFC